jgi:hypothetical protein
MSYNSVFGGNTIYPSNVSYLAVALTADITLEWPLESNAPTYPAASIIDVTADGAHNITMPDATLASTGQAVLFNNLSASLGAVTVKNSAGATIASIPVGTIWQVYLSSNATSAGTWRVLQFGASTASVQASALAGYGLAASSNLLSQSTPVTTFNSTPRDVLASDRAAMFVWTDSGVGVLNLPPIASVEAGYFVSARNAGGGGGLNVDATGGDVVNGASSLALQVGDSATFITDGVAWYSLGLGQSAEFAFDYTVVDLTGQADPYTLSSSELNRIAYKFTGTLTHDLEIIVPSTIQQYWLDNETTGAFTLTVNTATGTPVTLTQGARGIYYCDSNDVVNAATAGISIPINATDGGTGQTSYTTGDMLYASGAATLTRLSAVATGNVLTAAGVGTAPVWAPVDVSSMVTGVLGISNGGTSGANATDARSSLGAAASGTNTDITNLSHTAGLQVGSPTGGAQGVGTLNATGLFINGVAVGTGAGSVTSVSGSGGSTGLTLTGGPITSSGTLTLGGTLGVGYGGTGATTAATARSNLGAAASGTNTDIAKLDYASGVYLSTATGGAQGVGTINATGLFVNGVAVGVSGGSVSSVAMSGGSTGLTFSGGPITTSGTFTAGGTLVTGNGGTGLTTFTSGGAMYATSTSALTTGTLPTTAGGTALTSFTSGGAVYATSTSALTTGTLPVASGGTGQTSYTNGQLLIGNTTGNTLVKTTLTAGTNITITNGAGAITIDCTATGTVSSVAMSGGSTGLTFSGGPITGSGTFTAGGTLAVGNGGTGTTTSTGSGSVVLSASPTLSGTVALASATFTGTMGGAAGSVTAPAYSASGDTNTGVYFSAADTVDITTGGTNRVSIASTGLTTTVVHLNPDGSVSAPAYAFSGDTNTGLYRIGADAVGMSAGGTAYAYWDTTGFTVTGNGRFYILNGHPPASAAASGTAGEIGWDSGFIYVCVAANTWKRAALSTW